MAVVFVELRFVSSEKANPSHCEIITCPMWQFLFSKVVSEKNDRHFVTPEKRMYCILALKYSYTGLLKCEFFEYSEIQHELGKLGNSESLFHLFFLMDLFS